MSATPFYPGDSILLKAGDIWHGEALTLNGSGTAAHPITISSYGEGDKPVISPELTDSNAIYGVNVSGWKISGLELQKAKDGVHFDYTDSVEREYLWIDNMYIHDMDDTYNSIPTRYNHISSGISLNGWAPYGTEPVVLKGITVKDIVMDNVNSGWWTGAPYSRTDPNTGFTTGGSAYFSEIEMNNLQVSNASQWGYSFLFFRNATITNADAENTGFGVNPYGAAAFVVATSENVTLDGCDVVDAYRGPSSSTERDSTLKAASTPRTSCTRTPPLTEPTGQALWCSTTTASVRPRMLSSRM